MRRLSIGIALAALCAVAGAQSLTGRWTAKVVTDGEAREMVLALDVDAGGHIAGYFQTPQSEDRIVTAAWAATSSGLSASATAARPSAFTAARRRARNCNSTCRQPGAENRIRARVGGPSQAAATTPPKVSLPAPGPVASNGLAQTPPMGWNSWNKFQRKVDDQVVRQIADAMVKNGMRDAGYVYVNIDDTWEGARDASGVLQPNAKFPT